MIVEFICNIFFFLLELLIGIFPKFPALEGLDTSFSPLFYVVDYVNLFISVPTLSKCCLILLVVYNFKFVWPIFMWLIRKIPGVS